MSLLKLKAVLDNYFKKIEKREITVLDNYQNIIYEVARSHISIYEIFTDLIREFVRALSKKILIYGMPESGKTTFIRYCINSNFSDFKDFFNREYKGTLRIEEEQELSEEWSRWISRWGNYTLTDTPGQLHNNQDMYALNQKIAEADTVLYFFRADELYNAKTRKRTLRTISSNIMQYCNTFKNEKKLVLVATHCDMLPRISFDEILNELKSDNDYSRIMERQIVPLSKAYWFVSLTPKSIRQSTEIILKSMIE